MAKSVVKSSSDADCDSLTSRSGRSGVLRRVGERGRVRKRRSPKQTSTRSRRDGERKECEGNELTTVTEVTKPAPPAPSTPPLHPPPSVRDDIVALDCEMVATRTGSALAQCSILSYEGAVLFHEYVRPAELIVDYRTRWSGILPHHMKSAVPHNVAVKRIRTILKGKILVGHDLSHDLAVIGMSHQKNQRRDTAHFRPLREFAGLSVNQRPSLKKLCALLLGRCIQDGCHSSLEDARAALELYWKHEAVWERYLVEQNLDRTVWLQDQYWPQEILVQC